MPPPNPLRGFDSPGGGVADVRVEPCPRGAGYAWSRVRGIDYMIDLIGIEHVGFSSDFDGEGRIS